MAEPIRDDTRPVQCPTCVFRRGGLPLRPGRLGEIQAYLIEGRTHLCHSPPRDKFACRGGRDYQLTIWYRLGIIAEPTDDALEESYRVAMSEGDGPT